ncbi:PRC-barrel domain-containing protein [Streptomyces sp. NPDC048483]|uniref:PRC-barrel domain-containing protein n=1 Tax=Streptomyces sp. NPDC048483 TaxID=3154927 RepID=UPI00344A3223
MQTDIDPRSLIGRKAFDRNGTKIGTIDEVYLDDATGEPEWAAVRTGLFSRDAFVPLEPSELADEGLRIPYDRKLIKDAPDFGVGRHLSPEQELQLYHHYRLDISSPASDSVPSSGDKDFGRVAGSED